MSDHNLFKFNSEKNTTIFFYLLVFYLKKLLIEIRSINFIAMLFLWHFWVFFSLNAIVTHKPTLASQRKIDCLLNNEIKKKSRECLTIVKENISLKLFVHCPRLVARKKNKNKTSLKKLLDFMLLQFFVSNCFFFLQ